MHTCSGMSLPVWQQARRLVLICVEAVGTHLMHHVRELRRIDLQARPNLERRDGGIGMRIVFFAVGGGNLSKPEILAAAAQECEEAGFSTLWAAEHVVLPE